MVVVIIYTNLRIIISIWSQLAMLKPQRMEQLQLAGKAREVLAAEAFGRAYAFVPCRAMKKKILPI
jgi:hypothetical protein